MALKIRIGRLEARAASLAPTPPCSCCGVRAGWRPIFDVVGDDGRSVLDGCPGCGFALGEHGRPLWALPTGRGQKQFGAAVDWRAV